MLMLAKVLSGLNDVDYASIKTDMNFIFIVAFKLFLGLTWSVYYAVLTLNYIPASS